MAAAPTVAAAAVATVFGEAGGVIVSLLVTSLVATAGPVVRASGTDSVKALRE